MVYHPKAGRTVGFTGGAAKQARTLPSKLQAKLMALTAQIQVQGPVRGDWPNYSKLGEMNTTAI
jgi:hypothetical protein